jgi:hypothetical protein
MVGVKSIAVMIRTFDRWATYPGDNEREYLASVLDRLAKTGIGAWQGGSVDGQKQTHDDTNSRH